MSNIEWIKNVQLHSVFNTDGRDAKIYFTSNAAVGADVCIVKQINFALAPIESNIILALYTDLNNSLIASTTIFDGIGSASLTSTIHLTEPKIGQFYFEVRQLSTITNQFKAIAVDGMASINLEFIKYKH